MDKKNKWFLAANFLLSVVLIGLTIRTELAQYPVGTRAITMVIQNDSDNQYTYGVSCLFEKQDEKTGVWQLCPGLVDRYFPAIGYLLPVHSTKNYTIPFIGTVKLTELGKYRV